MEYNFREIEKKWQKRWVENKTYQVTEDETKKKFYVLNMFPYPSGAGLHVGHPWDMTLTDFQQNNMPYKRDSTLQLRPSTISTDTVNSWIR